MHHKPIGTKRFFALVINYMADLPQGVSEQMSSIFLTKLFPMNFTQWVCYKKTGEPDPTR